MSGAIIFKGTWDATTNTPTLVDGTGQNGWQYAVAVAGTVNLGSGSITFVPGDFIIYNGSIWQKIAANTIAAAGTLTGSTLASGVTASSLTSVGTLINLTVTNTISGNINGNAGTVTNGVYTTDTGTVTNTMLSGSIANTKLTNSSISGKALGTNLDTLTLNTSGTGLSGSTTYNGSGAATFTVASNATSVNTVSAIVARDANGDFSAGTITATITGSVSGNSGTVTNGVVTTGSYADPAWITSLAVSKVGLANVTNESKATMFASPTFTGTVSGVTATHVGLGSVTNESKATMFASPTFTGTVSGVTATHVGLGNVTNESKATMFASPTFTGTVSGVTATHVGLGNVTNESKATMFASPTFSGDISTAGIALTHATSNVITTNTASASLTISTFNTTIPGSITIRGGNSSTAAAAGAVVIISAGTGTTTGLGGYLSLSAGRGGATATGGNLTINSGIGGATSGNSGNINIDAGDVTSVGTDVIGTINIGAGKSPTINIGNTYTTNTYCTVTIKGVVKLPNVGTSGFVKLGAGGELSADTNTYATGNGTASGTNTGDQTLASLGAAPTASPTFTGTVSGVTATHVGLGNVTNESKATMFTSPTFTGTVSGVTATHVGLGSVTNESKATMFASPTFTGTVASFTVKDSILASTTVAGGTFNLFSNLTGSQGLLIAGGNLTTGTDKYVYIGTGGVALNGNHATSTTEVHIGGNTSGSLTKIWSPLTVVGNIGASNLSGTNTGDQTIPTTLPASDVYAWAKAATKPSYTATEVGLGNVNNTADANKAVSSASTAGTATNHYGAGGSYIASSNSGTGYGSAIQVREAGLGGAQSSDIAAAPRLGFHWSGVVASSIVMEASGRIGIVNNPGTAYEAFVCGTLTASNFSGSSSGTNTGDQTLPTLASLGAAPTASPTFTGTVSGVTATHVGLGNVTNESKATMFSSPTFTGTANLSTATQSTSTTTGALTVAGGAGIVGNLNVGGGVKLIAPSGDKSFSIDAAGYGNALIIEHNGVNGYISSYGTNGDLYIRTGSGKSVRMESTAASTSTTTGALIVSGGVGVGGDIVAAGSVTAAAFYYSSDATLKTNIGTLTNYWETLDALRPVSFDWISNGKKDLGLLAQDVQSVMPGSVTTTNDGTLAISSSGIIANLVAAVKDLKQQVEELTKQLKG